MNSKPKSIVINVPTAIVKISPLGFHHYGSEFFEAGESFNKTKKGFSPVPYYLYLRSVELLLKAFLLSNDIPIEDLKDRKKFGHHLVKVLKKAKSLKIDDVVEISLEEEKEVSKANAYYASKGFEYFEIKNAVKGYPNLPDLEILKKLASKLVKDKKLKQICLNA